MKLLGIFCVFVFLSACQKSPGLETNSTSKTPTEEKHTAQDSSQSPPELVVKINRQQTRNLNLSTTAIGKKIRSLIFDTDQKMTIEELLDQQITLTNNTGRLVSVPVRSVMDTVYFE